MRPPTPSCCYGSSAVGPPLRAPWARHCTRPRRPPFGGEQFRHPSVGSHKRSRFYLPLFTASRLSYTTWFRSNASSRKAALSMRGVRGKTAVVLDRHPLWLEAMADLLEGEGLDVVARAHDAETAVALVEEHRPDVLVAGIDATDAEAADCIRRACESHPDV